MRSLLGFIGGATLLLTGLLSATPTEAGEIAKQSCIYANKTYSHGAIVCMSGAKYICRDGKWKRKSDKC